jgi:hypothetical protein
MDSHLYTVWSIDAQTINFNSVDMQQLASLFVFLSPVAAAIEWKATVGQEGRLRWEHGVENANRIRWEHDKRQIAYWADSTFKLEPGYNLTSGESWTTLVIKNVTKEDAGNYTCQAHIIFGPPEATGRSLLTHHYSSPFDLSVHLFISLHAFKGQI